MNENITFKKDVLCQQAREISLPEAVELGVVNICKEIIKS